MRRFICGTTWRTGPAARAADDGRVGRPAGTGQRRDATRGRRGSGSDQSVVLTVATPDGDQAALPPVAAGVRSTERRRYRTSGSAARVAPVGAASRTVRAVRPVRIPSDEFHVIAASGGADGPLGANAAIVAIGPPGGPLRRARTAWSHLKRVFRRDVKVPATNEATNNPAGRARRSARVRHALASPCRTP